MYGWQEYQVGAIVEVLNTIGDQKKDLILILLTYNLFDLTRELELIHIF